MQRSIRVEIASFDAQVLDRKTGAIIKDLRHSDFEIFEDGIKQQLTMMSEGYHPLSILILMDINLNLGKKDKVLGERLKSVFQPLGSESEIALAEISDSPMLFPQEFSKDRKLLLEKISSFKINEKKKTANNSISNLLHKAALQMAKASYGSGRRFILVITGDQSSITQDKITQQALYELGSVVYGLIVSNDHRGGVRFSALQQYADNTGGEIVMAESRNIPEQLERMFERIRLRYIFGYEPTNEKRDGTFRYIRVGLTPEKKKELGDVTIKARLGYYSGKIGEK